MDYSNNSFETSIRSSELSPTDKTDKKCAPSHTFKDGSCIQLDVLLELVNAYNEEDVNAKKINLSNSMNTLNPSKYKKYLVKKLKNRLSDICDNQNCWIKQKFVLRMKKEARDQLKKNTLRPMGPNGKDVWLDTYNINNVLKQYEYKYNDFKSLGAVPVDFDELPAYGIDKLNFKKLHEKGINRIGIVFNLDDHTQGGSHWVAGYTDLKKGDVYFFDSYGMRPVPRINAFLKRAANFCKTQCSRVNVGHNSQICETNKLNNKVRHQYGGSECGVYSINFILRLLKGESFEFITNNKTSDDDVNKCRDVYFLNGRNKK
jgi:hypothetical protein